ncbi:FYVE, RhoGEF and PH domain-containing protein 4-like isoform X1 [Osmia bicornis bicornis]|uniref:FYVE, RhoGEF and PH domain-containing protein 4-like isoform X1 n=1 Tax=Osmia bicornis bicornis TaxID=1437191 RepID=UPI0010F62A3A|nr:FYVE, RhoGEF and PH domain-containing protein 4-like isoform X1 [Osmia bicornis bicornis]XP_029034161.1 FYVE, RhoGEF and PH domain-containing protein 4-like isoform X1 [Osmia bicornis bicornis]XP_029034162.1 FYVE, RhoGEF and PH domain-containing protein 4-like isoform X1 [Osmia bicornis bicornis]XP_029034165.1 FYVE, RhoGEF and PH domain-containing protein 4-like isoform X1 [Osmia bicornis bicornis]XP_029034166.1 FYVE, RhoGEF and PH domain-containing protein 4-like isoform X1 [Osmia bicornis 
MQQDQSIDVSFWITKPFSKFNDRTDLSKRVKMFTSKTQTSNSTFYTELESDVAKKESDVNELTDQRDEACMDIPSNCSDTIAGDKKQGNYNGHSFRKIASFGGFSRFRPFVMSAESSTERVSIEENEENSLEVSFLRVSHGVLEYRNSRYLATERNSRQYEVESYAISESESEEESDGGKSLETDSVLIVDHTDDSPVKLKSSNNSIGCLDSKRKKARQVAEELLATEKNYVNVLRLIDQVFQFKVDQENRAHPMFPPETVQHMFSNIKSIYKFHHDFLLPQLEERMENWESDPRIGDIMKNFAPFLKMYTEYVKNFDYAMNLIQSLQTKVARFAAIINEIQKLDECAKLSLPHHMLSPIQRLPRYELLLKDYLRNLTEESADYEDTKNMAFFLVEALELVSTAANHTNEAMKKIDKFKKLLEIQESIYDTTDLVSATRELVKEGRIVKISARSGDHQERQLFLFSDLLLLCSIRLIPGPLYRLRAKFLIENLEVIEGDNLETANTFYIRDKDKSVELYTHAAEEKAAWLDALLDTMQEMMKRKASLKTGNVKTLVIKTDDVSRCMICEVIFSVMKRKHNCRACGIVVCSKCSNQKLLFQDNKNMRVCRLCHAALTQPPVKSPSSTSPSGPVPSLLQVSANASSVIYGYLMLKTQPSKPWMRRWFALHVDFVLYTFKSESENMALTATPMPGFIVTEGTDLPEEDPLSPKDRSRALKMHHSRKSYYLQASSNEDKDKWFHALQLATKAELPSFATIENEDAQKSQ